MVPPQRPPLDGTGTTRPPAVEISVVVAAQDAAATVERTVAAILAQATAARFELIVVDHGSRDDTAARAAAAGARLLRLDHRRGGPGHARNAGAAAASGRLLAFTDADCFPTPGWLAALVRRAETAEVVAGPVAPDRTATRRTWDRTLEYPEPSPLFPTANLLVPRAAFDAAGGFEDWVVVRAPPTVATGRSFGEDTDLAWRLVRAGARTGWAPQALVEHAVVPRSAVGWIGQHWDLRHMPGLVRRAPELRRELLAGRVVLGAGTGLALLALGGLATAVARRRPGPLVAAAPYLLRQARTAREVGVPIAAVRTAGDLVGAAALAFGSVRHRSLVL